MFGGLNPTEGVKIKFYTALSTENKHRLAQSFQFKSGSLWGFEGSAEGVFKSHFEILLSIQR